MDIIRFLKDYNIPFTTEGKNVQQGWAGIRCPLCFDHSTHGGFNLRSQELYYYCWKCGWHPVEKVLAKLVRTTRSEARRLIEIYSGRSALPEIHIEKKPLVIPGGKLQPYHKNYLLKRRFDPDVAVKKYKIRGTGPVEKPRFSLVFPITYEKMEVSYDTRDITDLAPSKSWACPKVQEIIPHKEIFYGLDFINDIIIIVEGVFDAWRIGDGALATFGTSVTPKQIRLLYELQPKRVFVMFDAGETENIMAQKLSITLSTLGLESHVITLSEGDPDDLTDDEVKNLRKELGL